MDISIEGAAGQSEFAMSPIRGIQSADGVFRLKQAVKEMGRQQGYDVTFMSKPRRDVGNGLHFNHSLWTTDGRNAFHDPAGSNMLSELCLHWLAGLIEHGPAMTALLAPTVNCYRRFASPYMSPARFSWGIDHRLTSFRVKATSPSATYIENRPPSGSANPYLVLAATVAAGLDGIKRKLVCPPPCDLEARFIPTSLEQTLTALEADKIMVEALGEEFVEHFVLTKRLIEVKGLKQSKVDSPEDTAGFEAERAMYFRFL
jgi:glutamine synthetase